MLCSFKILMFPLFQWHACKLAVLKLNEWLQQNKTKNKSLYLSVRVFSTVVLIVDTVNKQTNITN